MLGFGLLWVVLAGLPLCAQPASPAPLYPHSSFDHYTLLGFVPPKPLEPPAGYYEALGVDPGGFKAFDEKHVKKHYRSEARLYHPDKQFAAPALPPRRRLSRLLSPLKRRLSSLFLRLPPAFSSRVSSRVSSLSARLSSVLPRTRTSAHPAAAAADRFQRLQSAADVLSSPSLRSEHDASLQALFSRRSPARVPRGESLPSLPLGTRLGEGSALSDEASGNTLLVQDCQLHLVTRGRALLLSLPARPPRRPSRRCALRHDVTFEGGARASISLGTGGDAVYERSFPLRGGWDGLVLSPTGSNVCVFRGDGGCAGCVLGGRWGCYEGVGDALLGWRIFRDQVFGGTGDAEEVDPRRGDRRRGDRRQQSGGWGGEAEEKLWWEDKSLREIGEGLGGGIVDAGRATWRWANEALDELMGDFDDDD